MVNITKCLRCNRKLKNQASITRKYGTYCFKKLFGAIAMINGDADLYEVWYYEPKSKI